MRILNGSRRGIRGLSASLLVVSTVVVSGVSLATSASASDRPSTSPIRQGRPSNVPPSGTTPHHSIHPGISRTATLYVLYVRVGSTGVTCATATAGTAAADACGTIQTAVNVAEATFGFGPGTAVTITVGPGTYTEHTITVTLPSRSSLTIVGKTGAAATTVDGSELGSVFTVNEGVVTIDGLSIEHGTASDGYGGGIDTYERGTITLEHDVFATDHAYTYSGGVNVTGGGSWHVRG